MRVFSPILLALCLAACASTVVATAPQPHTYMWLSQPGLASSDARAHYRDEFDAVLRARGYTEGEHPALALSIATDAQASRERDIGYGVYSGGFSYFAPRPAPAGFVEVVAFDVTSMRPAWRARWPAAAAANRAAFEQTPNTPHPLNREGEGQ